jgi:hypothetical protein
MIRPTYISIGTPNYRYFSKMATEILSKIRKIGKRCVAFGCNNNTEQGITIYFCGLKTKYLPIYGLKRCKNCVKTLKDLQHIHVYVMNILRKTCSM